MNQEALLIHVRGLVQGVGFRPFVYRIASLNHIRGWVENNNEGVRIHAEGQAAHLRRFLHDLRHQAPPASDIQAVDAKAVEPENFSSFHIRKSADLSDAITAVSPDIAVCDECLNDMRTQPHRLGYPFTNCTNCGPRFTIIKALPYDRHQTTMAPFRMCPECEAEYTNILDRRFHAQPVACNNCGPQYCLPAKHNELITNAAAMVAEVVNKGGIVALKGMGGYHLLCDAHNEEAVQRLRMRKQREGKPFAVMVAGLEAANRYFEISAEAQNLLSSWRRPVVLLPTLKPLAPSVSNGLHTTGVMLPYMPVHYQLFELLTTDVLVFTSGNVSDEPVIISDREAVSRLAPVADLIVGYNREIHNRADDSVAFVAGGHSMLLRRSRSWAPEPLSLAFSCEGILATGAELSNTFAIGRGNQAILSQHIGDLKNAPTLEFFEQSLSRFSSLFRFRPALVACDLHPDYLSTQYAQKLPVPAVGVQHHHAHMASCMAEHGLRDPVIGLIFDGTGLGTDGTIWGGECLTGDYLNFDRHIHLEPLPLPGGDQVTRQPWRTAFAWLWKCFGPEKAVDFSHKQGWCSISTAHNLVRMLEGNLNSPLSSGAGRLFDAVAALTGLCTEATYHAEAPMRLEAAANLEGLKPYPFEISSGTVRLQPMLAALLGELAGSKPISHISSRFHITMAHIMHQMARSAAAQIGLRQVVLSGGIFQNRRLLLLVMPMLKASGFEVYVQQRVPCNDGGIALGQLAVAAARQRSA
ncbi:MAG: carbamoyltransferase HypF [Bacteroidetes bacterium]|nr:carbamoyltransferase HypF [Bacteroidota bacterium]